MNKSALSDLITNKKVYLSKKDIDESIAEILLFMGDSLAIGNRIEIRGFGSFSSRVREAFRLAEEERPGAVHLELPEDIAQEETLRFPLKRSQVRRPVPDEKAINQAIKLLESSLSPLLILGGGANRTLTNKMLLEFIEKTEIPFITTQLGKGVLNERHPLSLGCAALSSGDFVHGAIQASDLIITVGHDDIEKPPFVMLENDNKSVIHVNHSSAAVDAIYFPQLEIVGDIANSIWQIKENISKNKKAFDECYDLATKCFNTNYEDFTECNDFQQEFFNFKHL